MSKHIKNFEIEVNDILTVHAGAVYKGKVTEVEKHGFWLTEDYNVYSDHLVNEFKNVLEEVKE